MDDQLMVGILLIIVGIAVGLIAVALVLNRREDRIAAELNLESDVEDDEEAPETEDEDKEPTLEVDEEEVVEDEPSESNELLAPPDDTLRERQLVAEIYREEVTGKLIVLSGDREYTDGKQIIDEGQRRRLAYAASDLADWFQGEFEPGGRPTGTSSQVSSSPDQMLEEINEILQRSLVGTPDRGVRLFPDAAGGVKVLVGVKSYEIEEVPDEEVRDLIKQAVAEWEAGQ